MKTRSEIDQSYTQDNRSDFLSDAEWSPHPGGLPTGAMARLEINIGRKHGARPGDVVEAIADHAGVSSEYLGTLFIGDRSTLIDVADKYADQVIGAMQHATIRDQVVSVRRTGNAPATADPPWASGSALRNALFNRVEGFLRESIARLDERELMVAVEAPTPGATIARVLAAAPDAGIERDGWTEALLRGTALKQEALRAAGGTFSSGEVAAMLGITVAGVKQRQRRGKLLAVPVTNGEWGYPARQFGDDGRVREGLARVLDSFGADADPWVILSFLVNPVPGSDTGIAFDALSDADAAWALAEVARSHGEQGAA